jgi:hypothetical protein
MSAYTAVFATDARAQILATGRWWRANRPANPIQACFSLSFALP